MPIYETLIKRRNILRYRDQLEKSQWWSNQKLLDYQWQELKKLLNHAYTQTPYWKKIFTERGITPENLKNLQDLQKLPIITKDDIRQHKTEMIAENYKGKTWTKSTGGSTGVPLELDYTPESYDWRTATTKRGYGWAGCEDGLRQAYIWGTDIKEPTNFIKFKRKLHQAFMQQQFYNCFQFDQKIMAKVLNQLNQFKPKFMIGYTNPLYNFALFIKNSPNLKFKPKAIITGAEKLHEYQRQEISQIFNAPVFNTYGSREFMLIASECSEHNGLHMSMENLYVEVVKEDGSPAQEGEKGDILITDLHNFGMPFIRYKIGDIAEVTHRHCACGRGLSLLKDVIGRNLDILKTPDGKFIPGEFFPHLMKEFKGVQQFQVIQHSLDKLTIKIIKNNLFKETDFSFIKEQIHTIMGNHVQVNYEFVTEIPLTKTGKFRVTISEIKNN